MEVDVAICAVELGRVVCVWMQNLKDVADVLVLLPAADATECWRVVGDSSAPHTTVLAHLIYVSVLWSPAASKDQDMKTHIERGGQNSDAAVAAGADAADTDADVADHLHAALLSGLFPPPLRALSLPPPSYHPIIFPSIPCALLHCSHPRNIRCIVGWECDVWAVTKNLKVFCGGVNDSAG